ncbi:hypothetical protein FTO70_08375 [Methanosarcina sp. KYL-1]|uniref:restriction endonuclease n=1 Tax=Methanosarcina sp. KYL-1 TaxID=2602068 RepID=UPI00210095F2|nr:hypothetical protein [Methanosarcina sp. KYL-1]MCQ1535694.1 hypothetical protein [Methanosarcina sp. KYL-1]
MKFWLLKAAGTQEDEEAILENSIITIGWSEFPDLAGVKEEAQMKKLMLEKYPGMPDERCGAWAGEICSFMHEIKKGDLVAVPLKTRNEVLVGRVSGDYEYRQVSNFVSHVRNVRWMKTLPKGDFEEEYEVDLNSPETLSPIEADPEKLSIFLKTKSIGALLNDLNFALEDLETLRGRMLELVYRLAEAEEIPEVRKIAAEMERMLRER